MALPPIDSVPSLSTEERAAVLDLLFEPSTPLRTLAVETLQTQRFDSYNDLVAAVGVQLTALADSPSSSDTDWLLSILGAHPRLGEKVVDSASSRAEQAHLNTGGADEAEALAALNQQYEAAFPGLRYVVFVDGRPRQVILDDMQSRIRRNDFKAEQFDAIKAMCDIAADRARKLLQ